MFTSSYSKLKYQYVSSCISSYTIEEKACFFIPHPYAYRMTRNILKAIWIESPKLMKDMYSRKYIYNTIYNIRVESIYIIQFII